MPAPALRPAEPEHLAKRMRDGDAAAFEDWVRATHDLVFRLCRRLVDQPTDTEDAVQETYIRAWRNLRHLRDPAAHRGWVCQIARRVCADRLRAGARREVPVLDAERAGPGSGSALDALISEDRPADEQLHGAQVRAVVLRAIVGLPEKYRIVLLLREIEELGYEEIADALGVPRGTVESRLHRARAQLTLALQREHERSKR